MSYHPLYPERKDTTDDLLALYGLGKLSTKASGLGAWLPPTEQEIEAIQSLSHRVKELEKAVHKFADAILYRGFHDDALHVQPELRHADVAALFTCIGLEVRCGIGPQEGPKDLPQPAG